jgi:hypothetical protein
MLPGRRLPALRGALYLGWLLGLLLVTHHSRLSSIWSGLRLSVNSLGGFFFAGESSVFVSGPPFFGSRYGLRGVFNAFWRLRFFIGGLQSVAHGRVF